MPKCKCLRRTWNEVSNVPLSILTSWGERAHVDAPVRAREADCLRETLHYHVVRSRMADLLRHHTFQKDEENELARLVRIERTLKRNGDVSVGPVDARTDREACPATCIRPLGGSRCPDHTLNDERNPCQKINASTLESMS
jgi:hypothetical protein